MSVRCSNCGHENSPEMRFCTACGQSLKRFDEPPQRAIGDTRSSAPKKKSGGALLLFAGLGCFVLFLGGIVLIVSLAYFAGQSGDPNANLNAGNKNDNAANVNKTESNRSLSNKSAANANTQTVANSSNANNSSTETPDIRSFLPPQVGDFERQGDVTDGSVVDDFPGADKIVKSDYLKQNKRVNLIMAQFNSPATAKQSYQYFLDGFKGIGAKVLTKQKIKNKAGVQTGEVVIYTYKNNWETMVYADRFGFRITSSQRQTLAEFLQAFGNYITLLGEN